jgi:hypothetical protein
MKDLRTDMHCDFQTRVRYGGEKGRDWTMFFPKDARDFNLSTPQPDAGMCASTDISGARRFILI